MRATLVWRVVPSRVIQGEATLQIALQYWISGPVSGILRGIQIVDQTTLS